MLRKGLGKKQQERAWAGLLWLSKKSEKTRSWRQVQDKLPLPIPLLVASLRANLRV